MLSHTLAGRAAEAEREVEHRLWARNREVRPARAWWVRWGQDVVEDVEVQAAVYAAAHEALGGDR